MKSRKQVCRDYYLKHREVILAKLKTPEEKARQYKNEKKYRKTEKGKAATHRAYINRLIKESTNG